MTALIVFVFPKPTYESPDIFELIDIPESMPEWTSKDVSDQLDVKDERYRFISEVFARQYYNSLGGERLLFLMLDAGNFHNPKVCFGASGYGVEDVPDISFTTAAGKTFHGYGVYAGRDTGGTLILYWITIDKKQVNWTEQKLKQFWASLLNKQKIGLMVRVDIPTTPNKIKESIRLAQRFVRTLSHELSPQDHEFIFGA
jgi:hypothetical protein